MKANRYGYVSLHHHSTVADINGDGSVHVREGSGYWSAYEVGTTDHARIGRVDPASQSVYDNDEHLVGRFSGADFSDLSGELQGRLIEETFLYLGPTPADYAFWRIVDSSATSIGLVMALPGMARKEDLGLAYAVGAALLVLCWSERGRAAGE